MCLRVCLVVNIWWAHWYKRSIAYTQAHANTHVWCVTHLPQITHTSLAGIGCVTRYSLLHVNSNTQCGCSSNMRHRRLHAPTAPAHLRKISVPRRLGAWAQSQSAQKSTAKQGHHHSCEFLSAHIYVYIYALADSTGVRVLIYFLRNYAVETLSRTLERGRAPVGHWKSIVKRICNARGC